MTAIAPNNQVYTVQFFGEDIEVNVLQANDVLLQFNIFDGNVPFNLTGYTLACYLKANAAALDGSGSTITPTVVSATLGQITVAFAHTQLATSGTLFYHIDATESSLVTTLAYGNVNIIPV